MPRFQPRRDSGEILVCSPCEPACQPRPVRPAVSSLFPIRCVPRFQPRRDSGEILVCSPCEPACQPRPVRPAVSSLFPIRCVPRFQPRRDSGEILVCSPCEPACQPRPVRPAISSFLPMLRRPSAPFRYAAPFGDFLIALTDRAKKRPLPQSHEAGVIYSVWKLSISCCRSRRRNRRHGCHRRNRRQVCLPWALRH